MTSDFRTFLDLPKSILRPLTLDEVAAIVDVDRNRSVDTAAYAA